MGNHIRLKVCVKGSIVNSIGNGSRVREIFSRGSGIVDEADGSRRPQSMWLLVEGLLLRVVLLVMWLIFHNLQCVYSAYY